MTRINKTQFPKTLRKDVWKTLWKNTRESASPSELMRELSTFLSPTELSLLEKRIATLLLLQKGTSYREIGRTIDITRSTISFVKHRFIKTPNPKKMISQKRHKIFSYPPSTIKTLQKELQRKK